VRVVSLLPSATDIVTALGCGDQLVGVTHSCDLPRHLGPDAVLTETAVPQGASSAEIDRFVRDAAHAGEPLYQVNEARIAELRPDLIVTQALCAVCAVPETRARELAVSLPEGAELLSLTPSSLEDVFSDIASVASALGVAERGARLLAALRDRVAAVVDRSARIERRPRVVLLEWLDPPFASGHWSPELVRLAGGTELIGEEGVASRTTSWAELREARPEVLFVACCGQPTDRAVLDLAPEWRARTGAERVYATDGHRYFSRPGPALVDSLEMLAHALHPALHPLPAGVPAARCLGDSTLRASA
jgi:iron complex transport system substrate-binding protein